MNMTTCVRHEPKNRGAMDVRYDRGYPRQATTHRMPSNQNASRVSPSAPEFEAAVQALLRDHPDESGARLLHDGLVDFAVRTHSARLAARSLDVQTYIWHDD